MVAVAAVLGIMAALVGLYNGLPTSYRLTRKVLSDKGEKEAEDKLKDFIVYLESVREKKEKEVTRHSKCSETSLEADLKPLEAVLKKSWETVDKWNKKNSWCKRLESEKYIKIWENSEATIARRLQVFLSCTRTNEEGNPGGPQTHEKPRERKKKESEEQEKEKEKEKYKAWIKKNITKSTDLKGATNSKLDPAERERLFQNPVDGLHKQCLKDYKQLLKEVITHQRARQNPKCLKYWTTQNLFCGGIKKVWSGCKGR